MVQHNSKVDLVRAPIDKSKPVTRMTTGEANHMGLITQPQARGLAEHNGGVLGSSHAVKVENAGVTSGSYNFRQTTPSSITVKHWSGPNNYTADHITRTVPITGNPGESARARMTVNK